MHKSNREELQKIIFESLINTYNAQIEKHLNLSIISYTDNQVIYLKIYKDSAIRPIFFCQCESEEDRNKLIDNLKKTNEWQIKPRMV